MVKNFLDYYNAVNKRKRKTNEEKEYTKHLQYVKNKSYSENKDQYDEVRKNLGYQPDDRLTKRKYDTYVGNEKTGDTGIGARFEQYYKEHPDRKPVQQELNKPFKSSKELKVNNNQEKANKPSSNDGFLEKTWDVAKKVGHETERAVDRIESVMTFGGSRYLQEKQQKEIKEINKEKGYKLFPEKDSFSKREGVGKYGDMASDLVGYLSVGGTVQKGIKGTKLAATHAKDISKIGKVLQTAKEGASIGGIISALETPGKHINENETTKESLKRIGLETGLGAVGDVAVHGIGKGLEKLFKGKKIISGEKTEVEKTGEITKITEKLNKTGKVSKADSKKLLQDIQSKQLKEVEAQKVADEEAARLNPTSYPKNFEGLYHIKDEYPMDVKAMLSRENQAIKNGVQPTNQAELIKQIDESPALQKEINQMNQQINIENPEQVKQVVEQVSKIKKEPEMLHSDPEPKKLGDDYINHLLNGGEAKNVFKQEIDPAAAPLAKIKVPKKNKKILPNTANEPLPENHDSVDLINSQISREVKPEPKKPIMQRVKDFANKTYYNMFDDAYGLSRLDKARGKSVRDADSAVALAHRSRGSGAKAQQELERGFFNKDGEKVGLGFSEVLQRAKDPDKLENYLVAKGILDYDSKGMTALNTNGLKQLDVSNAAVKQLEAENPEIVKEAQNFYDFLKNQRSVLAEGGILNEAQIKQMEENNPNYVPMERVRDEGVENFVGGNETLRKRLVNVGNPVKKRTGSERQIISPFETTVKRQYIYNNFAERNKAGMAVLDHIEQLPEDNPFGTIIDMEKDAAFKALKNADDIVAKTDKEIPEEINKMFHEKDGDNNIVYVYKNGDKYKIQIKDKMLFDSVMSLDSKSLPVWMNAINLPVRMLRAGVTLSPDFAVRNFLRDQITTGITSEKGYVPFVDAINGAFEILKGRKGNSELLNAYTRNGGDLGLLQNIDRTNTFKTLKELKGNETTMERLRKIKDDPALLFEPLRKIGEFSEKATRIGHMKKATKKGASLEQAAYDARSTMDFNRAGAWGRQINQGVAFFNASMQGMDVLARSFKDNPVRTAKNIGLYVVAPTYALYMMNKDQQWFKDLPTEDRDRNWFIPAGDQIIKIPKPFEPGILFGAGLERGLDKHYNGEGGEGYIKELADAFTPDIIPTAVKPLLEVMFNKNTFTGNAIDSMSDELLPAKDRYNAYNSQFSIKMADLLSKVKPNTEISPKDIDNLVRGYTGTLGTTFTETSDKVIGAVNSNVPDKPSSGLQTTPFIRSLFVRNLEGNNKPTNDFYKLFDEMRQQKKVQGDKFKYASQKKVIEKTYRDISDLQKEKKDILNDKKLDGKDKAKQIKKLNEQITEMARKANELKPR